jgi:hypothetical protein
MYLYFSDGLNGRKRLIGQRDSMWQDLAKSDIAILGFWIPAIPAGMTRYLDVCVLGQVYSSPRSISD